MSERFSLPARLDSSGAAALVPALLAQRGKPLTLDAGGVEVIGARALEVLVAAGRQWALDGQPLQIDAPSERFGAVCATLGLRPDMPWSAAGSQTGVPA